MMAALIDEGPAIIIFCARCGGMAEHHARLLASPQCGAAKPQQQRNLARIEQRRHPARNAVLIELWRLAVSRGPESMKLTEYPK